MGSAYRYYVIDGGSQQRVFATAWPMARETAERALLAQLTRDGAGDARLLLSAGSSAIAPQGAAVIMLDEAGSPHLALVESAELARHYLAEMGIDEDEGLVVPVELLRAPRRPRFSPELLGELAEIGAAAGLRRTTIADGPWCPSCLDARLGEGQTRCDACLRIDALLVPLEERAD